jgi:DNA-binding LacI/PurR family transcriptional regulator
LNQATIQDVAKKAGVSKTTVSHVINVGIVVSDISNPFFGEILLGVEEILRPKNCALIICNTNETLEDEAHYLNLLLNQRVDGIIAAATSQPWIELTQAEVQHTPIVFVDRTFENQQNYYVGVDNKGGAYQGTQHLIQCGYRKIGILAGLDRLSTMRERLDGYCQALTDAVIPVRNEWIIPSQLSVEGGRQAMRELFCQPDSPEAVFINNNLLALGALLEMRELDLNYAEDVGIVSFDDHPWAAVSSPPLTVVRQPTRKIGQTSAEMILALINNQPVPEKRVILDCEFVERQSCRSIQR